MTLTPELEAKLQRVLAERSTPGAVTDYRAGTLSDRDREATLRANLHTFRRVEPSETTLKTTDEAILTQLAYGF